MSCMDCETPKENCHGRDEHGHCDDYTPPKEGKAVFAKSPENANNETLADIVAEMRDDYNTNYQRPGKNKKQPQTVVFAKEDGGKE